MAISKADWDAIWNEGFDVGWNDAHHASHPVRHAPSNDALRISKDNWQDVWQAGFQAAYGKHTSAPAPQDISTIEPPAPPPPPAETAGGPVATAAGAQGSWSDDQWHNIYTIVKVGYDLHAPGPAIVAGLLLGYGENTFHTEGCNGNSGCGCARGCCGLVQIDCAKQAEHDYHDVAYWMRRAYEDGFWSQGGLIELSRKFSNESPGYWVNLCQGAYSNYAVGAQYYDRGLSTCNDLFNYWYPRVSGGARAPAVPGGGYVAIPTTTPHGPGAVSLEDILKGQNWAGSFEVLWQHVQSGTDEAAKAASAYLDNVHAHEYVKPA